MELKCTRLLYTKVSYFYLHVVRSRVISLAFKNLAKECPIMFHIVFGDNNSGAKKWIP